MDAIAGLLDGPRAREAFFLCSTMDPPWSLRIRDEAPLTVMAMVRGESWVLYDDAAPQRLGEGDVAIARGPEHYTVASDPEVEPQAVIHPGQLCTTPDGKELDAMEFLGVRTWGNTVDGGTQLLTGTYGMDGDVTRRVLRAVPQLIVMRAEDWNSPLIPLLAAEIVKDDPGQEAVLDRLLDVLLIDSLRAWFARSDGEAPGWYRANGDPVVGHALRLIHDEPAGAWTVASLADTIGVSRATLARRFNELVGEPPMSYLTEWRIALAADLLREPGATVGSVAAEVGYGSPYALSTAFKRVRGVSPKEHREAVAA
jgi:AraC-like DNA-binding protein